MTLRSTPKRTASPTAELRALPASLVGGPLADVAQNAWEAIVLLREVYCSSIGFDLAHIFVPEEREWLRHHIEARTFRGPTQQVDKIELLDRITEVETFERFLHKAFVGKTRFSIEGLDTMVPILDELIADSAMAGVRHVLIGMAHRGRLNVLAHVMQKSYVQILAEFKEAVGDQPFRKDLGWTGDVKYHAGARARVREESAPEVAISMPPNPSHLEFVNPVVVGMARAACTDASAAGSPVVDKGATLPILIHGDAAFPGQGVVAETLNLSRLRLYDVGGTVHIIANNQIGFTATARQSYSTSYASGLVRGFKIPIFHVNADDPEACIEVARLTAAYRAAFKRDTLIDLVGYRRHGHNEGDEPSFTQPAMYSVIASHPTVRELWSRALITRGVVTPDEAAALVQKYMTALGQALETVQRNAQPKEEYPEPPPRGVARQAKTAVPLDRLRALNADLTRVPAGFTIHKKLERGRDKRRVALDAAEERTVDWATAEDLAFASILADGIAVRLTGEDVERGTFSHRHAVYHDSVTGDRDVPLQRLSQARAGFEIYNSPLTECATIGFEFGYNLQAPGRLVVWEAQYGDFINGAQVILDEFLTSGRAKWGLTPSLVLLLPHGYEGQGPDHSSARVERFLEAAADINLRIANCTTAGQYFHLLRRQAVLLLTDPLPLIVLTPKSLLRHPLVASAPRDLAEGRWQPVIPDGAAAGRAAEHPAARALQREGLRGSRVERTARRASGGRHLPGRAALPLPVVGSQADRRRLRGPRGDGVGAGGAGEHGRVGLRPAAHRGSGRGPLAASVRGPRALGEPVGRHDVVARGEPEDPGRGGVRLRAAAPANAHGALEEGVNAGSGGRKGKGGGGGSVRGFGGSVVGGFSLRTRRSNLRTFEPSNPRNRTP